MPIYNFKCTTCDDEQEILLKMNECSELQECQKCKNKTLTRNWNYKSNISIDLKDPSLTKLQQKYGTNLPNDYKVGGDGPIFTRIPRC